MGSKNSSELWINWEEVIHLASGKRIIFFGRGEWFEKSIPYVGNQADYVVDNNEYEQNQIEHNLNIFNPSVLKNENLEEILIIITTTGFQEVTDQLIEFGLLPGRHFIISPSLRNFHSIQRINQQNCTLLVTCADRPQNDPSRGGGFYSYELQTRRLKKIFSGVCHGFISGNDSIYLVDDLIGVRVLNKDLTEKSHFSLPAKSRPHGIAFSKVHNKIFINFAGRDSIGVYDAKTYVKINEIFISNKCEKTSIPQHHLNDLYAHGDSLYVSMFSLSGNWKRGVYDGGILEVDIETLEIKGPVVTNLWMPHSPVILNGNLCYCDSMRGVVHNTTWKSITQFNGFVRGIAHDGEFYYVGQSMHRYVDRLEHATNNISLDTGIYIVDEHNKTTKFFSIHQLTDIKAIALMPTNFI